MMKHKWRYFFLLLVLLAMGFFILRRCNFHPIHNVGDKVDEMNGVAVFYNGGVGNVVERNTTKDGYNLGLKYQCVEFVKRYYYEYYNHKMPDAWGNAKDFYDPTIADGKENKQRALLQYSQGSISKPQIGDLIVLDKSMSNPYGHVAIISDVQPTTLEIIQQNPGINGSSRATYNLSMRENRWFIENKRTLGWLRMK